MCMFTSSKICDSLHTHRNILMTLLGTIDCRKVLEEREDRKHTDRGDNTDSIQATNLKTKK